MGQTLEFEFIYELYKDEKENLYGVRCLDGNRQEICSVENIGEKSVTEKFCRMLNEYQVYPCHLYEIYEDCFGGFYLTENEIENII